jgi:hypothetical protein
LAEADFDNQGTAKVKCYQIPQTNFYLMDTPGFDDTFLSDAEILKEISDALMDAFHDEAEIQGALYVHPVVEARMRGSGRKNLIMFKKVLGAKGMKNCRLVTTKWTLVDEAVGAAREKELCESNEFWAPLLKAGATTVRFHDSTESAMDVIRPLALGHSFEPQLVGEMRDGKRLDETEAGQQVNDDINKAHKANAAQIKELEKDMREALAKKDLEHAALLKEETKELLAKVKKLEEGKKIISQSPMPVEKRSGAAKFGRWIARTAAITAAGALTVYSGGLLAAHGAMLYLATEQALQDA